MVSTKELYKTYVIGDMQLRYIKDEEDRVGLCIVPASRAAETVVDNTGIRRVDPLVQIKIAGDAYSTGYANGKSLRNGATVRHGLRLFSQTVSETGEDTAVTTVLKDERGIEAVHVISGNKNVLCCNVTVTNGSDEMITLEKIESFSLSDITPFEEGLAKNTLSIYRMKAEWQNEGVLEKTTPELLMLAPTQKRFPVLSERFGQLGIKPVLKYAPFVAVRDNKRGVIWGGALSIGSSWMIELYRRDHGLAVGGGIADADFGLWTKNLEPGESFSAPTGFISVCEGDIDDICARMTDFYTDRLTDIPECEESLPIQYNEYRASFTRQTYETIMRQAKVLKGRGVDYYMIDAGWFKDDDNGWFLQTGDWQVNKKRFPEGVKKTVDDLKEMGFLPGIWFEPETCGNLSYAFNNEEEHMLKRYGKKLVSGRRCFWDMNDPWVKNYMSERVIGFLKENGFGYVKFDSNENVGAGCDGAESPGEGLRQYALGIEELYRETARQIPGIVIENCSAGGARAIDTFMRLSSLTSFSDSFDQPNTPFIAANMQYILPARQNLIWCVIDPDYDDVRMYNSLSTATMGRMCMSGNIAELNGEQNAILDEGIAFYKKCVPIIKNGTSRRIGTEITSSVDPVGWQAVIRTGKEGGVLVTVHTFEKPFPDTLEIDLKNADIEISERFARGCVNAAVENGVMKISGMTGHEGAAFILR